MKTLLRTALILFMAGAASSAYALGAIPFGELDVNRDDALTMTEAGLLPDIISLWGMLDRDGDGRLNRGEYAGYRLPEAAMED